MLSESCSTAFEHLARPKSYEVYSQRFQPGDFDEDQKYDPKVLPEAYLKTPNASHAFVYVSTIQRMTINLFGRDAIFTVGDEELDEDAKKLDIPYTRLIWLLQTSVTEATHHPKEPSGVGRWADALTTVQHRLRVLRRVTFSLLALRSLSRASRLSFLVLRLLDEPGRPVLCEARRLVDVQSCAETKLMFSEGRALLGIGVCRSASGSRAGAADRSFRSGPA